MNALEYCLGDELLVAYLSDAVSGAERASVETHLGDCDRCVELLPVVQRRLHAEREPLLAVPESVRAAARGMGAVAEGAPHLPHAAAAARVSTSTWRDWLAEWRARRWSYRTLVPAAVALVAVVAVAQRSWLAPPPVGRSRAVQIREALRVTAPSAEVFPQAGARPPHIAELARGTRVEIVDEDGDWYRVVLDDGRAGWMERRAFE
jgi:hypothetical protein